MRTLGIDTALKYVRDVLFELLWPTRCAVCDVAGERLVCEACIKELQTIDAFVACPRCGAPYGVAQCTECNDLALASNGLDALPFDSMASALILDESARRIVCAYKDHNERRLSPFIAKAIALQIGPETIERHPVITYVPDSKEAYRRRGFDHSKEIAKEVANITGLPYETFFSRPMSADQRKLGRRRRIENMKERLKVIADGGIPENVVLVDDVCTTGATIYSACLELRRCGAKNISVVTFGRVLA